ncbi:hypothetical protein [Halothermothrix orenii]|uniref:hypothetical protein n=1 Tax=Halothermothrix orenii TaxID=31909 RepID=UPI00006B0982|nr:hypothetical protein [Halothermothrix orenii]
MIIGPVYWQTNDPVLAWQVGLAACLIGGLIEILGAFIGKKLIKIIPRAALLGNLAAGAMIWLSLVGLLNIFDKPWMAIVPLFITLIAYFGKWKTPYNLSPGLLAIIAGTILAWSMGSMDGQAVVDALKDLKINTPVFSGRDVFLGLKNIVDYLPIVIPLQLANFLTTLQGLESAAVAGDKYPVKTSMTMDGVGTIIGSFFGNPFPTTVYYGHPSWKELGARAGYSVFNGITYLLVGLTGTVGVLSALIPFQVVMPILVFVGFSMSVQTFSESPRKHIGGIMLAFIPLIAQYLETGVNAALTAVDTDLATVGLEAFGKASFPIKGVLALSQGAFLSSLLLAALLVSITDKKFVHAAGYSLALSFSSAVGLIHSPQVTWLAPESLPFVVMYLVMGVISITYYLKSIKGVQTGDANQFSEV